MRIRIVAVLTKLGDRDYGISLAAALLGA